MTNRPQENQILDLFNQESEKNEPIESDRKISDLSSVQSSPFNSQSPTMILDSLHITNLWSYDQTEVNFEEGTSVIAGMNGSGKSSLLESIFFALYGSKAGPAMDRALSDVLRIGSDLGFVTLKFQYGTHSYTSQMALRKRGDKVISEKEECKLIRSDGETWVGVDVVTQEIEHLFGMNRDDFTNCVYVRQGEIDRLIRAGGKERRDMIDRLLRLEKLDKYAKRSEEGARRAINRYSDQLKQRDADLRNELKRIEQEQPEKQLGDLEVALKTHQAEIQKNDLTLTEANALKQKYVDSLKKIEASQLELKQLQESLDKKEEQLKEQEARSEKFVVELQNLKQLYESNQESLSEGLKQLEVPIDSVLQQISVSTRWDELEVLRTNLENAKKQQIEIQAQAEKLQTESTLYEDRANNEILEQTASLAKMQSDLESLQKEHKNMCDLVEQGLCPGCGQPVEGEDFSKKILAKQQEISELEALLKEKSANASESKEALSQHKQEISERIARLREDYKALDQSVRILEHAKETTQQMFQSQLQAEQQRESHKALLEMIESTREDIANLKIKLSEQSQESQDVEALQGKLEKVEAVIEKLVAQRTELQQKNEQMLNARGVLQNKFEQLAHIKQQSEKTQAELESAQGIQDELLQLSEFYGSLKRELRSQNIDALEHYFNTFFHVMDSGASYSGVKISPEYEIAVELKGGNVIKPELLSGGERALINIALRSAIHQVLSQATSRMPLILDEPTIYLDRDRVTRLQYLLEELGSRIGQVIVVSHEVGLVDGADHEYRTEKRADNTSHVYQVR